MNKKDRFSILNTIWNTKRYNNDQKKIKILSKNLEITQLKENYLENISPIIISSKNLQYITKKKKRKHIILKRKKLANLGRNLYPLLFKSSYSINLLNNSIIDSSLNNLFYKFYNIPKFINYNSIINYFKNYKIILNFDGAKKKHNIYKKMLHKNSMLSIDLKNFIKMYGFR